MRKEHNMNYKMALLKRPFYVRSTHLINHFLRPLKDSTVICDVACKEVV